MNRPDCHYCDGTGSLEEQTDVDDFRSVECDYCAGTGTAMRSANTCTRWLGPVYWTHGAQIGDALVILSSLRRQIPASRGQWREPSIRNNYQRMRDVAMKPARLQEAK